jgi:hypothetical protein
VLVQPSGYVLHRLTGQNSSHPDILERAREQFDPLPRHSQIEDSFQCFAPLPPKRKAVVGHRDLSPRGDAEEGSEVSKRHRPILSRAVSLAMDQHYEGYSPLLPLDDWEIFLAIPLLDRG